MLTFQKLRVYQVSLELLALTIDAIDAIPKGHAELADQLLRAVQSQPRNIAEGAGRVTNAERARFYAYARGSAMEAAATFDTMRLMHIVDDGVHRKAIGLLTSVVSMLTKMM